MRHLSGPRRTGSEGALRECRADARIVGETLHDMTWHATYPRIHVSTYPRIHVSLGPAVVVPGVVVYSVEGNSPGLH